MEDLIKDVALQALQVLAPVLATVLAAAITAGIVLVLKKLGVDVSAAESKRLKEEVLDVVEAVEEIAEVKKAEGAPLNSGAKLSLAVDKVKIRFPRVSVGKIEDAIHAALPKVGLGRSAKRFLNGGIGGGLV